MSDEDEYYIRPTFHTKVIRVAVLAIAAVVVIAPIVVFGVYHGCPPGTACYGKVDRTYPAFADAVAAGAVELGWIPAFVPPSATGIHDMHDEFSADQSLKFTVPVTALAGIVSGLEPPTADDELAVARATAELGWNSGRFGTTIFPYKACGRKAPALLLVNTATGDVALKAPVDFAGFTCPAAQ